MYYQEDNSLLDVTVDSLELLMQNGKIKKLRVDGQMPITKPAAILIVTTQQETEKPIEIPKRSPRVATFQEEKEEQAKQEAEPSMDETKKRSEEMVIKFLPEEDEDNSLSGLSRSIGKLWDAESMVDVWETNN